MEKIIGDSCSSKSYWRLSGDFLLEEQGYGAELFHTYCKVGERACAMTIDHYSLINAVGIDMVKKLELSMTPHPRPYSLRTCHDRLDVSHQTKVQFSVCQFSCEILCDVIPVPMVSCHLLLGEPWYKEHRVAYHCLADTYTIKQDKSYILKPMDKKLFRSWRKERLLKINKQEAEASAIISAPLKSDDPIVVLEPDLKPRTVSIEEGEDDTGTPASTVVVPYPIEVEPNYYLQLTLGNGDESRNNTSMHLVAVQDMGAYAFWTKHQGIFTHSYASNNEEKCMHGRWTHQESVHIFSGANTGEHISYYFGSPRPPEQVVYIWKFLPWRLISLKSIGWGPPTCMASKDMVQELRICLDIQFRSVCIFLWSQVSYVWSAI